MSDFGGFSAEEIMLLAEAERMMDNGEMKFVMWGGHRLPIMAETAAELGLRQGQTVSDPIVRAIFMHQLSAVGARAAVEKAAKGGGVTAECEGMCGV